MTEPKDTLSKRDRNLVRRLRASKSPWLLVGHMLLLLVALWMFATVLLTELAPGGAGLEICVKGVDGNCLPVAEGQRISVLNYAKMGFALLFLLLATQSLLIMLERRKIYSIIERFGLADDHCEPD